MEPLLTCFRVLLGGAAMVFCSCAAVGVGKFPDLRLAVDSGGGEVVLPEKGESSGFLSGKYDEGVYPQIRFEQESFRVVSEMGALLDRVAEQSKREGKELLLAGFVVGSGSPGYARVASERLALEVRSQLISRGVEPNVVSTVGLGDDFSRDWDNSGRWVIVGVGPFVQKTEKIAEGDDA